MNYLRVQTHGTIWRRNDDIRRVPGINNLDKFHGTEYGSLPMFWIKWRQILSGNGLQV